MTTITRNATLGDLAELLRDEQTRKLDVVTPAASITARDGQLVIAGAEPIIDETGVTDADGVFTPTSVCDEGIASKLSIPLPYVRRMRDERPDLWDANVNGWLHGAADGDPDDRKFLVRCLTSTSSQSGVARAFLSDSYRSIDHLDTLTAVLQGVRDSGAQVSIDSCDLTERRMFVRVSSPDVAALAPTLLARYRSPFSGAAGADNPTVFAGFVISNSEVGCGAFSITPRLVVSVCSNGMTMTSDALRSVHLGSKLSEGVVRWSDDTQRKNLDLVTSQARDAVATFLDRSYVERKLSELSAYAERPVEHAVDTIAHVSTKLAFTESQRDGILDHFIRGGDTTAGGVLHAVTSYAQTVPDADDAARIEDSAVRALQLAATL